MTPASSFTATQTFNRPNGSTVVYALSPKFLAAIMNGILQCKVSYGIYSPGGSPRYHYGYDVSTKGTDWRVFATAPGKVKYARMVAQGAAGWGDTWQWGYFVWIVGDDGYDHIYAHLKANSLTVTEGARVSAGQQIGTMGKTGNAAGDAQAEHVHYEVRKNGTSVDPTLWLGMQNLQGWVEFKTNTETKGVQTMKVVDVYAALTAAKTGGKPFNVQTFSDPDVTKIAGNNLPDGRYWCNVTGVTLKGLPGYEGAEIIVDGKKVYVAIIPGATEYTEMTNAEAYDRFIKTAAPSGYTEAEMKAVKAQLDTANNKLADAQGKITAAQKALG